MGLEGAQHELLQYGAIGAMLLVMLVTMIAMMRSLFARTLSHMDDFSKFMTETVKAMQSVRDAMTSHHSEIMRFLPRQRRQTSGEITSTSDRERKP